MKLGKRSTLEDVAGCVAKALSSHDIRSVLTGGACASLYTGGAYQSAGLDFILRSSVSSQRLETAMRKAGFERRGNQYFHPDVRFFVEFPSGPLAIGGDSDIQPVALRIGGTKLHALSPTDCCRDRLAAFYHWSDRQGLKTAVQVALRHSVDHERMRRWSRAEGASAGYDEFASELQRAVRAKRGRSRK